LSVQARVPGFTLKNLLNLGPQTIVRSQLASSASPPLRVNGEVVAWCDFEVLGSPARGTSDGAAMSFKFLSAPANSRATNSPLAALWLRLGRYWMVIRAPRPVRQMHVRETLQIGDKRQLMVVDVGERQLLIGAAGNCLTMLAELDRHSQTEQAWKA
jgi:hypothetical protein